MPTQAKTQVVTAVLNPQHQTIDNVHKLMAKLSGLAGCTGCGRIAYIDIHFHGDPDPSFRDLGAISVGQIGF